MFLARTKEVQSTVWTMGFPSGHRPCMTQAQIVSLTDNLWICLVSRVYTPNLIERACVLRASDAHSLFKAATSPSDLHFPFLSLLSSPPPFAKPPHRPLKKTPHRPFSRKRRHSRHLRHQILAPALRHLPPLVTAGALHRHSKQLVRPWHQCNKYWCQGQAQADLLAW
jgi:hypothetical protein